MHCQQCQIIALQQNSIAVPTWDEAPADGLSGQSDGDLFVMPTLETSMAAASEGALRDGGGAGQTVDQALGAMRDMDLDAALLECASARGASHRALLPWLLG